MGQVLWLFIGGAVCFDALTKNQPKGSTAQRHTNGTVTASSLPDDHVPTDPFAWVKLPSPWILRLLKYYISTSVVMGPLTLVSCASFLCLRFWPIRNPTRRTTLTSS